MDLLSCHVYEGIHYHYTQNDPCIGLLYSTFPLTAITFCHVSPNPMAVPELFLQDLKKRTKTFRKKLGKIKMFVFEIAKVIKCSNDDLGPELYGIYILIISNERKFYELQVV